jgi:hypothetical protein
MFDPTFELFSDVLTRNGDFHASDLDVQLMRLLTTGQLHDKGARKLPPETLVCANTVMVATVSHICACIERGVAKATPEGRASVLNMFLKLWRLVQFCCPLSFDGLRGYLWTASPVIPVLFLHVRNCLAPAFAQDVIHSTTLPSASLRTSGSITLDLIEALSHCLSITSSVMLPLGLVDEIFDNTITWAQGNVEKGLPLLDSGRLLLQGNVTGVPTSYVCTTI